VRSAPAASGAISPSRSSSGSHPDTFDFFAERVDVIAAMTGPSLRRLAEAARFAIIAIWVAGGESAAVPAFRLQHFRTVPAEETRS
jgi:hypothetical protein